MEEENPFDTTKVVQHVDALMEVERSVMVMKYFSDPHSITRSQHRFKAKCERVDSFDNLGSDEERILAFFDGFNCVFVAGLNLAEPFQSAHLPMLRHLAQPVHSAAFVLGIPG